VFNVEIYNESSLGEFAATRRRPTIMSLMANLWVHGKIKEATEVAKMLVSSNPHDAWLCCPFSLMMGEGDLTQQQAEVLAAHPEFETGSSLGIIGSCIIKRGNDRAVVPGYLASAIYGAVDGWSDELIRGFLLFTHFSTLSVSLGTPNMAEVKPLDTHGCMRGDGPCLHCRLRQAFAETFHLSSILLP
jgi:hypothetical protein